MTHRSRKALRGLAAAGAALTLTLGVVAGGQAADTPARPTRQSPANGEAPPDTSSPSSRAG